MERTGVYLPNNTIEKLDFFSHFFVQKPPLSAEGVALLSESPMGDPDAYVSLREKEGRICNDDELRHLPYLPIGHRHAAEWALRARSTERLVQAIKDRFSNRPLRILEVGCGNGWLTHRLASETDGHALGLDNNLPELAQAARIFDRPGLHWACGDVMGPLLREGAFDVIVLAASIQYFPSPARLLERLDRLLTPNGEIHVLDSPFYSDRRQAEAAAERSKAYYRAQGYPEMAAHYWHHTFADLGSRPFRSNFNPKSLQNRLLRYLGAREIPFPHLVFTKP
jgi:SAM-dependent methyltransferase